MDAANKEMTSKMDDANKEMTGKMDDANKEIKSKMDMMIQSNSYLSGQADALMKEKISRSRAWW